MLICLRHSFRSTTVANLKFIFIKEIYLYPAISVPNRFCLIYYPMKRDYLLLILYLLLGFAGICAVLIKEKIDFMERRWCWLARLPSREVRTAMEEGSNTRLSYCTARLGNTQSRRDSTTYSPSILLGADI